MNTYLPERYAPLLGMYDTQKAIGILKTLFEDSLSGALHLRRVSAPLFVDGASGLNDNLNGVEQPVTFNIRSAGRTAEVVHSLAKWKHMALKNYCFRPGNGLYTDMNAIRPEEDLDNLHSVYVDQWDWEKVITEEQRNVAELRETVVRIVGSICSTSRTLRAIFPALEALPSLTQEVHFVTSQELEDQYPDLTGKQREDAVCKEFGTVFLIGIGGKLRSGKKHDGRAPDYDDWTLNGDLLFWSPVLNRAVEISSMGIRVDPAAMDRQLHEAGCDDRRELPFHKALLNNELPLTIGGGIGQSRLCMLLLGKAHIGEVQASVWDEETIQSCEKAGIPLL